MGLSGISMSDRYWLTKQVQDWYKAGPFIMAIQHIHATEARMDSYRAVIKRDGKALWFSKYTDNRDVAVGVGKQRLGEMARAEQRYRLRVNDQYDATTERLLQTAAVRSLVDAMSPVPSPTPKAFSR